MILSFSLISIQASLLHPSLCKSKISKYLRRALTPLNVYLFITSPFRSSSRLPESFDTFQKLGFGSNAIIFAVKALEYGFAKSAYYTRPIESVDGIWVWKKIKDPDELKALKKSQEEHSCNLAQLFWWTILNLTSFRGLQFTSGPTIHANNHTIQQLIKRFIKVAIPLTISGFILIQTHRSPLQTPISALQSLGIPNTLAISLVSEWIHRISFGICLSSTIDLQYTALTMILYPLHTYLKSFSNLSHDFLELINPIYYPPLFDKPHLSGSLNDLWSNRWHSVLKRTFLTLGGKPTFWFLNQILGLNFKLSQIGGLIGTFIASGILHEYTIFALLHPVNPLAHLFDHTPALLYYFIAQSFAIILEGFLPKQFSKIFFIVFSMWICKPFINRYVLDAKILDQFL